MARFYTPNNLITKDKSEGDFKRAAKVKPRQAKKQARMKISDALEHFRFRAARWLLLPLALQNIFTHTILFSG
jgi:hypothetical protein